MKPAYFLAFALFAAACSAPPPSSDTPKTEAEKPATQTKYENKPAPAARPAPVAKETTPMPTKNEIATFATGCYWCSEAIFQRIDGVVSVRSGFTGGTAPNPTYEQVCTGETGHAESVEVTFDPSKVSYETLLDWFWRMHDPTSLNRQGADEGTQYRSAIFWHTEEQRAAAEKSKKEAQASFKDPIVTEITKAGPFYPAPAYHDDYYNKNTSQGYCRAVIAPKLHKLNLDEKK
jgi:peptide-methionine (S)-S-oxide reductase